MRALIHAAVWVLPLWTATIIICAFLAAAQVPDTRVPTPAIDVRISRARYWAGQYYHALAGHQITDGIADPANDAVKGLTGEGLAWQLTPQRRVRLQHHSQRATLATFDAAAALIDGDGYAAGQACLAAELTIPLIEAQLPQYVEE